jgi:hypothetical protein
MSELEVPEQNGSLTLRRTWSKSETKWVFESCEGLCFYCDSRLQFEFRERVDKKGYLAWEIDHCKPFSENNHTCGGPNHYSNLVASCWKCNNSKLDSSRRDWWVEIDVTPRCLGLTKKGYRCKNKISNNNYKYCSYHSN